MRMVVLVPCHAIFRQTSGTPDKKKQKMRYSTAYNNAFDDEEHINIEGKRYTGQT